MSQRPVYHPRHPCRRRRSSGQGHVQLRAPDDPGHDVYQSDFTTTEQAYTEGTDDPFGIANNTNSPVNILTDSLADAFSRINSLPAIGTSGTGKLLGMIYAGSF